jgi:hypothetical protein
LNPPSFSFKDNRSCCCPLSVQHKSSATYTNSTLSFIYTQNYRHHARLQGTSRYRILEVATRGGIHTNSSADLTAIAQDVISGDELISDSYDLETVDGVIYEANGAKITIGGEQFDTGANASAEGGDEDGGDEAKETKINIVHAFQLNETQFDKKAYLGHLKGRTRHTRNTTRDSRLIEDLQAT